MGISTKFLFTDKHTSKIMGYSNQNNKFCHYLLTLMSVQTCMTYTCAHENKIKWPSQLKWRGHFTIHNGSIGAQEQSFIKHIKL